MTTEGTGALGENKGENRDGKGWTTRGRKKSGVMCDVRDGQRGERNAI